MKKKVRVNLVLAISNDQGRLGYAHVEVMKKKVRVNLVQAISNDQGGWDVLMLR